MSEAYSQIRLKDELASRCERNARYSVRGFAASLGIDAGTLSKVLSGKQIPALKLSQRLVSALGLDPAEQEKFYDSILAKRTSSRSVQTRSALSRFAKKREPALDLTLDIYRVIADFHHFAILELTYTEGFRSSNKWIAQQLGISEIETKLAVERLLELGLLKKEAGRLVKTANQLASIDKHLTTPALKKNQRQFLERALHSLENDPIEVRKFSSMTMAIDPELLPLARQMIQEFSRNLCTFLESGKRKRVYNLEVALYPIQKSNSETEKK